MTEHFRVFHGPGLGTLGARVVREVLLKCESDYDSLSRWFKVSVPSFRVTIVQSLPQHPGFAYHASCRSTDLYCSAPRPGDPPFYTNALVVCEAAEVFEAYQHKGWDCGSANGEGLSRALAGVLYPGALKRHACASAWLNGARQDLVNFNYPTHTNLRANGCSVLFLNWLHSKLGYEWRDIVAAAAPTLAKTYHLLTGSTDDPFPRFKADLDRFFPPNRRAPSVPDNPFPKIQPT
jgi:hypothetical protein